MLKTKCGPSFVVSTSLLAMLSNSSVLADTLQGVGGTAVNCWAICSGSGIKQI